MSMSTMQFSSYTNMLVPTKIFINTKVTWSYVFGSACPVAMEKRGHIRKDWMGWYGGWGGELSWGVGVVGHPLHWRVLVFFQIIL